MGLDLSISPRNWGTYEKNKWHLAFTRMNFDRDYDVFAQINDSRRTEDSPPRVCDPKPMPAGVKVEWYGEDGINPITEDAYGSPLMWVTAGELSRVVLDPDSGPVNRAILAYVRELPPETPVVLYWH